MKNLFKIIEIATLVHVSSFVLLTGYYQSTSKFKQSKVWKILNASWFYRTVIVILFITMNIISVDKLTIFKNFFPLEIYHYWFIETYILLYLIIPLLNAGIKAMDKQTYKRIIITLFIVFCVLPWITNFQTFSNNGYTLYQFIYLYLIGGYLRKYPILDSCFFNKKSNLFKRSTLLFIMLICVALNYLVYQLSFEYTGANSLINEVIKNIQTNLYFIVIRL